MSEPEEQASSSRKNSKDESQSECIDPELDIRSEHFNPLKALYAPEIDIPVKNAPHYNNIAHYESALKRQQAGGSVSFISNSKQHIHQWTIQNLIRNSIIIFLSKHLKVLVELF